MQSDRIARERFRMVAEQPRSWFRVAEQLLGSARVIWESRIEPACSASGFKSASAAAFSHMRGFYVLAGFSAENFIKGVLVAQMRVAHGQPIADRQGELSLQGLNKRHRLVNPAQQASLPLTLEQRELLTRLEPIVKWSGRYPVALAPTLADGLDYINAQDLRTLEDFAQLCRDVWKKETSKSLPGGRSIWSDKFE
jgi:hypothetical protein